MTTLQPLFLAAVGLLIGIIALALLSHSATHDRDPPDDGHTTDQQHDNGEGGDT